MVTPRYLTFSFIRAILLAYSERTRPLSVRRLRETMRADYLLVRAGTNRDKSGNWQQGQIVHTIRPSR